MHALPEGRASPTDRRRRRRRLLLTTATALVIATAATAFVLHNQPSTRLVLSTSEVMIGDTYSATASGFSPGESVRFSWTGPTKGRMDVVPVDKAGSTTYGRIMEMTAPGSFTITVTGLTSGCIASAGLGVTTRTRLVLSTPQVKIDDTYSATASGFSPRESVRFSWTGPTNGLMGVVPADLGGSATYGGILERDPPGNYSIIVTGLTSGRTASAGLQVIPAAPRDSGAGPR